MIDHFKNLPNKYVTLKDLHLPNLKLSVINDKENYSLNWIPNKNEVCNILNNKNMDSIAYLGGYTTLFFKKY